MTLVAQLTLIADRGSCKDRRTAPLLEGARILQILRRCFGGRDGSLPSALDQGATRSWTRSSLHAFSVR
jgi:hypothetical protein